jgi:hypothetical protein
MELSSVSDPDDWIRIQSGLWNDPQQIEISCF